MADCIDGEDDNIDIVILPPEKVDGMMDDEEIDGDGDKIDNGLPNVLCGTTQLQIDIPEIEENLAYADDN